MCARLRMCLVCFPQLCALLRSASMCRYLLVNAAGISHGFFSLVKDMFGFGRESEAFDFSRDILYSLAQGLVWFTCARHVAPQFSQCCVLAGLGKSDSKRFAERMKIEDPMAKLAAGPVAFAFTGWASVSLIAGARALLARGLCARCHSA